MLLKSCRHRFCRLATVTASKTSSRYRRHCRLVAVIGDVLRPLIQLFRLLRLADAAADATAAATYVKYWLLLFLFHLASAVVTVTHMPPLPPLMSAAAKPSLLRRRRCCCRLASTVADKVGVLFGFVYIKQFVPLPLMPYAETKKKLIRHRHRRCRCCCCIDAAVAAISLPSSLPSCY